MKKREYAYIRVSPKDQNISRQLLPMERLSIPKDNIYIDKQSGYDFKRPAYQKMLEKLQQGDIIYIKSIDRLGRNYDEILEQWKILTKKTKWISSYSICHF